MKIYDWKEITHGRFYKEIRNTNLLIFRMWLKRDHILYVHYFVSKLNETTFRNEFQFYFQPVSVNY